MATFTRTLRVEIEVEAAFAYYPGCEMRMYRPNGDPGYPAEPAEAELQSAFIGLGEEKTAWVKEVLEKMDRTIAAPTAPPEGLYFVGARYPDSCGLPASPPAFSRGWNLS